jgi:hypothetical protein
MRKILGLYFYDREIEILEIIDRIARERDTTVTAVVKALIVFALYQYMKNVYARDYIDNLISEIHTKKTIPFRLRSRH